MCSLMIFFVCGKGFIRKCCVLVACLLGSRRTVALHVIDGVVHAAFQIGMWHPVTSALSSALGSFPSSFLPGVSAARSFPPSAPPRRPAWSSSSSVCSLQERNDTDHCLMVRANSERTSSRSVKVEDLKCSS